MTKVELNPDVPSPAACLHYADRGINAAGKLVMRRLWRWLPLGDPLRDKARHINNRCCSNRVLGSCTNVLRANKQPAAHVVSASV